MKLTTIISWILSIIAAAIMLLTLQFKFTAHPESVALFSTLGVEPWGRVGTGILELIASLLLLIPLTRIWGSLLGLGLMLGAMFSHCFVIGIVSESGSAELFITAVVVLVCCIAILYMQRNDVMHMLTKLKKRF